MSEVESFCRFNTISKPSTEVFVVNSSVKIVSSHFHQYFKKGIVEFLLTIRP